MTKLIVAFRKIAKSAYKFDCIENVAEIADTLLITVIFKDFKMWRTHQSSS